VLKSARVKSQRHVASVLLLVLVVTLAGQGCSLSTSNRATASPSASATPQKSTEAAPSPAPAATQPTSPSGADGWQVVGTSVQGRPIRVLTVGRGPRKVLFVGGIHGDEPEGAVATAELPAAFTDAGLADAVTLTILEDANPDGRAAGTRDNANGVDVNRNFPSSNFDKTDPSDGGEPLSQPESRALNATFERTAPNVVLIAHSWAGRQFVNFDGPARDIAERFSASSGLPVEASSEFAPTPGSLGSYVGRDRGVPILTIEVLKGSNSQDVWERLRPALLQASAG
jgi:murein peptide amidase A